MASTMSPSNIKLMTDNQLDKIVANVRAGLVKVKGLFTAERIQHALERGHLDFKIKTAVIEVVKVAIADMANEKVRSVKVDRKLTPDQLLNAIGTRIDIQKMNINNDVLKGIPRGQGKKADVYFFHVDHFMERDRLEEEYELRGLVPDPYVQVAVNLAEPDFSKKYPNISVWKQDGKWFYLSFFNWGFREEIAIDIQKGRGWTNDWWFCGVPKDKVR